MSATGFHPEPSAKAPWTRTIVLTAAYAGDDAARAAPVRRARIKRFMVKLRQCSLQRPTREVSSRRAAVAGCTRLQNFPSPAEHHAGFLAMTRSRGNASQANQD